MITPEAITDLLNNLLILDPGAIGALFNTRIVCNEALAQHDTVEVDTYTWKGPQGKENYINFIYILNGLFPAGKDIVPVKNDLGSITRFELRRS